MKLEGLVLTKKYVPSAKTLYTEDLSNITFNYLCENCAFGFEAILHPNCYLTSILNKSYFGPVNSPFLGNFYSFFSCVGSVLVTKFFPLLLIDIFWAFNKL